MHAWMHPSIHPPIHAYIHVLSYKMLQPTGSQGLEKPTQQDTQKGFLKWHVQFVGLASMSWRTRLDQLLYVLVQHDDGQGPVGCPPRQAAKSRPMQPVASLCPIRVVRMIARPKLRTSTT